MSIASFAAADLAYPTDWPDTNPLWIALMVGDPESGGIEVKAAEYERKRLDLTLPPTLGTGESATLFNPNRIAFARAKEPWGKLTHIALTRTKAGTAAVGKIAISGPDGGLISTGDLIVFDPNSIKIKVTDAADVEKLILTSGTEATPRVYQRYFRETGDILDADYPVAPGTGVSD